MRTDITYVILKPEQEAPLGYIRAGHIPSVDEMAEHLRIIGGFDSVDSLLDANPGLLLGCAPLQ